MSNIVPFNQDKDRRPPPHSVEAEQQLLGALLTAGERGRDAHATVAEIVQADDFYDPVHARIFATIAALAERGEAITGVLVWGRMRDDAGLNEIGGHVYLVRLASSAAPILQATDYARHVRNLARWREAVWRAEDLFADCDRALADGAPGSALDALEGALARLRPTDDKDGPIQIAAAMDKALDHVEQAIASPSKAFGVPTGLSALDEKLGGLHPGQMIVLAARPGQGKTALALSMARAAAQAGHGVLFFSLEMHAEDLALRLCTDLAWIPDDPIAYERARKGYLSAAQRDRLYQARVTAGTMPLIVDARSGRTTNAMRATARTVALDMRAAGTPLGLIVIDYIGLARDSGRQRNKVDQVAEISADVKRLAKDLDVPVLALSQLNRGVESREDKRPSLADLRDSGAIEQDADVVLFPFREAVYLAKAEPDPSDSAAHAKWQMRMADIRNTVEIDVAKQRMGPTGRVDAFCDIACNVFRDLVRGQL